MIVCSITDRAMYFFVSNFEDCFLRVFGPLPLVEAHILPTGGLRFSV